MRGDGQATCAACAASCLSCSGPASTDCLSCPDTGTPHLDDGACVGTCPDGKYLDDGGGGGGASTCVACDATCRTCGGAGNASCLTCMPGVTFSAGACVSSCATVRATGPRCLPPAPSPPPLPHFGRKHPLLGASPHPRLPM